MIMTVEYKGETLALLAPFKESLGENTSEWFGKETEPLQGSRMHYMSGKSFKTHKHKLNPRLTNYTQEAFVVIRGKIQMEIFEYNNVIVKTEIAGNQTFVNPVHVGTLVAEAGDVIFVWGGYHKLSILEDNTICYEIKAGQFTTVQKDKEFMPEADETK